MEQPCVRRKICKPAVEGLSDCIYFISDIQELGEHPGHCYTYNTFNTLHVQNNTYRKQKFQESVDEINCLVGSNDQEQLLTYYVVAPKWHRQLSRTAVIECYIGPLYHLAPLYRGLSIATQFRVRRIIKRKSFGLFHGIWKKNIEGTICQGHPTIWSPPKYIENSF